VKPSIPRDPPIMKIRADDPIKPPNKPPIMKIRADDVFK
jgi:hypothetical protein